MCLYVGNARTKTLSTSWLGTGHGRLAAWYRDHHLPSITKLFFEWSISKYYPDSWVLYWLSKPLLWTLKFIVMAVLAICIDMPDLLAEASHPAESIASAAMGYLLEHLAYLLLQMVLSENEVYRIPLILPYVNSLGKYGFYTTGIWGYARHPNPKTKLPKRGLMSSIGSFRNWMMGPER